MKIKKPLCTKPEKNSLQKSSGSQGCKSSHKKGQNSDYQNEA